jgi:hypothetical protein
MDFAAVNVSNEFLTGEIVTAFSEIYPGFLSLFSDPLVNWYRVLVIVIAFTMNYTLPLVPRSSNLVCSVPGDVLNPDLDEKKTIELHDAHSFLGIILLATAVLHFRSLETFVCDLITYYECDVSVEIFSPVFEKLIGLLVLVYLLIVISCRYYAPLSSYTKYTGRIRFETSDPSPGYLMQFIIFSHRVRVVLALPIIYYSWPYLQSYSPWHATSFKTFMDSKLLYWICAFLFTMLLDCIFDLCILISRAKDFYFGKGPRPYYIEESRVLGNLLSLCLVHLALPHMPVCVCLFILERIFHPLIITEERFEQKLSIIIGVVSLGILLWNVFANYYYSRSYQVDYWLVRLFYLQLAKIFRENLFFYPKNRFFVLDIALLVLADFIFLQYGCYFALFTIALTILSVNSSILGRSEISTLHV